MLRAKAASTGSNMGLGAPISHPDRERKGSTAMKQGTVKWFNNAKGYGFVTTEEGEDVFVHQTAIVSEGYRSLRQGERVSFDVVKTDKGLQARDVKKV